MKVADCMTPDPILVNRRETIEYVAELIRSHRILQIPVVDDANRLVGIITDRDIRSAKGPVKPEAPKLVADDIMTHDVATVTPADSLLEAIDQLTSRNIGALPVVVGEHVVGMVSTRDLLRVLRGVLEKDAALVAAHGLDTFEADIL